MPTYEYRCNRCQTQFSCQASMKDPAPTRGPDCSASDCQIQKCISRVFGQVAGANKAPPLAPAKTPVIESPSHVCSKYCDQHG